MPRLPPNSSSVFLEWRGHASSQVSSKQGSKGVTKARASNEQKSTEEQSHLKAGIKLQNCTHNITQHSICHPQRVKRGLMIKFFEDKYIHLL